jgi:flagellar biosynthetic protein FliO
MVWGAKETPAKPSATESPKSSSPDAISPGSVPAATPSPAAAPDAPKTGYLAQYYRKTDRSGTVENPGRGSLTSIFFQMLGGLALVLGIAILGAALLKRASNKGFFGNRGRFWKVVEVVPLGPKRNLYVTQFVDRVVLLGATDQQITVLAEIHDPALALAIESGQTDFRRFLVPEAMENWANSSEGLEAEGTSEPAPAEGKTSARPPARKRTPESSPAPSFHRSTTL